MCNKLYFTGIKKGFPRIKNWILMLGIKFSKKKSVVILNGRGLDNTFSLVNYLEITKPMESKKSVVKIKVP